MAEPGQDQADAPPAALAEPADAEQANNNDTTRTAPADQARVAAERARLATATLAARLPEGAQRIDSRKTTRPDGRTLRSTLLKLDWKYPNVVFEGLEPKGNPAATDRELEGQVARLADHLLVKAAAGTDEAALRAAVSTAGGSVLRQVTPGGPYMVALPTATIEAVPQAAETLMADPRVGYAEPDYLVYSSDVPADLRVLNEVNGVLMDPDSHLPIEQSFNNPQPAPSAASLLQAQQIRLQSLPPEARVIGFDKPHFYGGYQNFYPAIEEQGYRLTSTNGILTGFQQTATSVSNGTYYNRLVNVTGWSFQHKDGLPFTAISIDLGEYAITNYGTRGVMFTGHKADGSTVSQGFTTDGRADGPGPIDDFQTFSFSSSFENLVRLTTNQSQFSLDNIAVVLQAQEGPGELPLAPPQIYDITWDAPKHTIDQITAVAGDYAPTVYEGGGVYVRSSIGSMTGPALELKGGSGSFQGISLFANRDTPAYRIEFDLYLDILDSRSLDVMFAGPGDVQKVQFFGNGSVTMFRRTDIVQASAGNFAPRTVHRAAVDIDLIEGTWKLWMNGTCVFTGPFESLGRDLSYVRFVSSMSNTDIVGLDNVKFYAQGTDTMPTIGPRIHISSMHLPFGDVPVGGSKTLELRVSNTGFEPLEITGYATTNPVFTLPGATPRTLQPGENFLMPVCFTAAGSVQQTGSLQLTSNDPGRPLAELPVSGKALGAPRVSLSPAQLDVTMLADTIGTKTFEISNTGVGTLHWSMVLKEDPDAPGTPLFPNDPSFVDQWALAQPGSGSGGIDAPRAWGVQTGSHFLSVAVVDTGVDTSHPDLTQNIKINYGETPNNDIDDDENGYIDDVSGWDFFNGDSDPTDDHGHGTHVAGIIAARGNNGAGTTGVSWTSQILPVKFLDANGLGLTSDAVAAVHYAYLFGSRVSNNSWGGAGFSQALYDEISYTTFHGQLFVAAAGNDSLDSDIVPNYPSGYDLDGIVSVASTTQQDVLSYFSNYGATTVDLAAPGSGILSLYKDGQYAIASGTSMAAPLVSGAAVLLASENVSLNARELKPLLLYGVDALGALAGQIRSEGRLNVYNSIYSTPPDWLRPQLTSGSIAAGATISVPLTVDTHTLPNGYQEKWITLSSNDPQKPKVDLRVLLRVIVNQGYSRWLSGLYAEGAMLANTAESTLWSNTADPDGNGLQNVLEYMFAQDTSTNPELPYKTVEGQPGTFEFQVRDDLEGVDYHVEWTDDLGSITWQTGGYSVILDTTEGVPPGLRRIRISLDAPPANVYFRLAATSAIGL